MPSVTCDPQTTRSARSATTRRITRTTTPPWRRRVGASLVALSLVVVLTMSLAGVAGAKETTTTAATSQPKVYPASGHGTALAHGIVDMAKLPILQPHAVTSAQTLPLPAPDALTPAQRQAYNDKARKATSTSLPGAATKTPQGVSPSFVGGGAMPLLVKQFDGLNSAQVGGGTGNAAIATDLSYVMEGVDNAIAIYSATSGAKLYGPYSPASFFAPVYHAGDLFAYPQMYYDTMRDRWIVAYLEVAPSHTVTYLDVAISKTTSPTQPTPGAQYNVYQFDTNFEGTPKINSYCDYETLGVDYWGVYITCVNYRNFTFVGNTALAINKAPLLTGAANPQTYWWDDALKITSDAGPALELSPAIEEGVQDAEFIIATDAGYGVSSHNLSVCALTNQSNIATVAPTLSCLHANFPYDYFEPAPAIQPGGPPIAVGYGTKQVYYKAGRLFLAWTSALEYGDAIELAEVRPILDYSNIPQMYDVEITQYSAMFGIGQVYANTPSIVGTDEDDVVLVYNSSGPSRYPGLYYTGRKASNRLGLMGPETPVVTGTHATTAYWAKYSACAISLNSVTRGGVWCVGEYTGLTPDPGWNTRLFNLRAE